MEPSPDDQKPQQFRETAPSRLLLDMRQNLAHCYCAPDCVFSIVPVSYSAVASCVIVQELVTPAAMTLASSNGYGRVPDVEAH